MPTRPQSRRTTPTRPRQATRAHRKLPLGCRSAPRTAPPMAASRRSVPANQIGALLRAPAWSRSSRTSSSSPWMTTRRSSAQRPSGRRWADRSTPARNVIVGVIDTGIWPEHPMVYDPGRPPRPSRSAYGCQFGDGTDVAHLGPTFTCNNKLIGAYAESATYMANVGLRRPGVLQQHDRRLLGPRLRGPRHPHHDDGCRCCRSAPRCSTASSAAPSAASHPART